MFRRDELLGPPGAPLSPQSAAGHVPRVNLSCVGRRKPCCCLLEDLCTSYCEQPYPLLMVPDVSGAQSCMTCHHGLPTRHLQWRNLSRIIVCHCTIARLSGLLPPRHFNAPGVRIKFQGAQHLTTLVRFLGFSWNLVHTKDGEDFCTVKRDSFTK